MELDAAFGRLAAEADAPVDVAEVSLLLARDEYSDLDVEAYLAEVNGMAREARGYVRGTLEARVHGLCRYLFHEMGFHGNVLDYYDPRNSYLNQVVDRRTGIPISLSALAMAVGQRVGLRIEGIGLPGHLVARAVEDGNQVLFDPFHGGRQLSAVDCENLVRQTTGRAFEAMPADLAPLPGRLLFIRMLNNLKSIYLRQKDFSRAARVIARLRQLKPDDLGELRDLGVALAQAGQLGAALDPLNAYLAAIPQGPNVDAVRQLRDRILAAVGRWN
jgi:regulator of sirC expression with transglutaminase-like and TPR domain